MTTPPFDSYAQNGEDVVLWRALHGVENGRYIDVGANHPRKDSVTMAFYLAGWHGITVEPDPQFAQLQREIRPRDLLVEAAVTAKDDQTVTLHVVDGTGLSTLDDTFGAQHAEAGLPTHDVAVPTRTLDAILDEAGWTGQDIHFLSVDTEGSEREVLESIDLKAWRPWVLVVEATAPNSTTSTRDAWEQLVVAAGYRFCLFDGLSCFYVAEERADELGPALSYPACVLDHYTTLTLRDCGERVEAARQRSAELVEEVVRWRSQALSRWADAMAGGPVATHLRRQLEGLQAEHAELSRRHHLLAQELDTVYRSSSWRLTRPVRTVGARLSRARSGR